MEITGIICEYNPFHIGHYKQFSMIRKKDPESAIVCLMSGNYVQRGMPAIFDKEIRARIAIECGADLVLELPVTASLSSAEGFASEGVRILNMFCHSLSFGAETPDPKMLMQTAQVLLSDEFKIQLKDCLSYGISFPAARQQALEKLQVNSSLVQKPNDILAVEYCKAIIAQGCAMKPQPILRNGDFHAYIPDKENPSATSLRLLIENRKCIAEYIPSIAAKHYENATVHRLSSAENAILYRLRTMNDYEFKELPYSSEGLWCKLMKNARKYGSLEKIITETKSKRYTRSRLDRMIMCAFLGLTQKDIQSNAPYVRVLALNDKGRKILLKARQAGDFPNIGEKADIPYYEIEKRCDSLYNLFAEQKDDNPRNTESRRIYYKNQTI